MVNKKGNIIVKNEDVAARLELLMNSIERVADELEELGYLDFSKKLDELMCELDVEMCALSSEDKEIRCLVCRIAAHV